MRHAPGIAFILLGLSNAARLGEEPVSTRCCEVVTKKQSLLDWLELLVINNLDDCCEDHASSFGWWALRACPSSFQEVLEAVHRGTSEATGGKSGAKVIVTSEYVVKTITEEEKYQLDKLLVHLRDRYSPKEVSFIMPTC